MIGMPDKKINSCMGCIYYYITWDSAHPKGCKYFGFKSRRMPCQVVKESTSKECNMYTKKDN
jgi:hypothetical protein